MNFIIENWYLILLALVSGGMLLAPVLMGGGAGGLTAANAVQLINREKAVVIDVCAPEEYAAGHVGGAKNVPLAQLEERLPSVVSVPWRWPRSWATTMPRPCRAAWPPGAKPTCP